MVEFNRILCPIDFSESSVRALAHAVALANWYEAHLTLLHVVPTFEPVQVRGDLGEPVRVVNPVSREQVLDELRRTLVSSTVSRAPAFAAVSGDAPTTIVDQALRRRPHRGKSARRGRRSGASHES